MPRARTHVKQSPIHGRGVFASRRFDRGDRIAVAEGTPTSRAGRHVLWVRKDHGSYEGLRVQNQLRYLNSSARPNSDFWGVELYALRVIRPGDEITLDYEDSPSRMRHESSPMRST